jgi:8-oxo-dGTP pyrophosphatase MutT (NUDIX family)
LTQVRNWTLLESHHIVKDRWLGLRADRCRTPDGAIIEPFYVLEYPDWVQIVPIDRDNNVLLIRQYRQAVGRVTLEIPAGRMDASDPDPAFTGARELLEETGCQGEEVRLIQTCSPNPATHANRIHTVLVTGVRKVQEPLDDPEERIESLWVSAAEAIRLARSGELDASIHVGSLCLALMEAGLLVPSEAVTQKP